MAFDTGWFDGSSAMHQGVSLVALHESWSMGQARFVAVPKQKMGGHGGHYCVSGYYQSLRRRYFAVARPRGSFDRSISARDIR